MNYIYNLSDYCIQWLMIPTLGIFEFDPVHKILFKQLVEKVSASPLQYIRSPSFWVYFPQVSHLQPLAEGLQVCGYSLTSWDEHQSLCFGKSRKNRCHNVKKGKWCNIMDISRNLRIAFANNIHYIFSPFLYESVGDEFTPVANLVACRKSRRLRDLNCVH